MSHTASINSVFLLFGNTVHMSSILTIYDQLNFESSFASFSVQYRMFGSLVLHI